MMYTKIASFIAGLALILGILNILMGVFIITSDMSAVDAVRYLGTKTTGELIDRSIYTVLFAVTLGVLSEISKSLSIKNSEKQMNTK